MSHIKTAVIGVGHQGVWHAEKFAALDSSELLAVVDVDVERARTIAARFGVAATEDFRELLDQVDAVVVATPTHSHYTIVKAFLQAGVHVLAEKPLAQTLDQAEELVVLAEAQGLILQGGHLERFNPAVSSVASTIREPRFIESLRIAPYKPRSLDVSVVLDLMIHDIDLIHSFVNAPIERVDAAGQSVFSDSIDIANARLVFANGCTANITSSRVSTKSERRIRVFEPRAYHSIDLLSQSAASYQARGDEVVTGYEDLSIRSVAFEDGDALLTQAQSFLDAVAGGSPPQVSGRVALEALRTANTIHELITGSGPS